MQIFNLAGELIDDRSGNSSGIATENYNLGISDGVYVLVLKSQGEVRLINFVVAN